MIFNDFSKRQTQIIAQDHNSQTRKTDIPIQQPLLKSN